MFPVGDFSYVAYPEFALIALIISAIAGVLVPILLKLPVRTAAVAKNAVWGATGSVTAMYVLGHLEFEYAFVAAITIAVALPALLEWFRSKRR
jgi:uncharacterized membrane protein YeaQ/YmgE (transglycosylase-associated protein family)